MSSTELCINTDDSLTCVVWKIDKLWNLNATEITSDTFYHKNHEFRLRIFTKGDTLLDSLNPPVLYMSLLGKPSKCPNKNLINCQYINYVMGIEKSISSDLRKVISISDSVLSTPLYELISTHDLELQKGDMMVPKSNLTVFCNIRYAKEKPAVKIVCPTTSTYGVKRKRTADELSPNTSFQGEKGVKRKMTEDELLPNTSFQGEKDNASALVKKLKDAYLSQRYTDVKIIVKDKEFCAHKVILCSQSEVFAAMFEHDTEEKRSGIVTVTDSDPESFECFLLYLYTGKLDITSSVDVVSLYKIAVKYDVKECIEYIMKGMTADSFIDIFHLVSLHGESDLLPSVTNFFIDNATVIMTKTKWLTLLEEHASLCNDLLLKFATRVNQK